MIGWTQYATNAVLEKIKWLLTNFKKEGNDKIFNYNF